MLRPRKKRPSLLRKQSKGGSYPTLVVALEENLSPDSVYEIAVLDLNTAGMGIAIAVPLTVGRYIFFDDNQPGWDLPKRGVVVWTFKDNDGFRAGIKFA